MSKRLQVIIDVHEYKSFQQIARDAGMNLGEWVRQALRRTAEWSSHKKPQSKLKAITRASRHRFPTGDIEDLLAEIETGRSGS